MNTSKGNNMKKKYAGYTVIEMLLVLLLVSLFASVSIVFVPRVQERLTVYQFLNQFEKNILLTQQSSLFSDEFTEFYREAEGERRLVFDLDHEYRIILPIPPVLKVSDFPLIRFSKDTGNMGISRKILFTWQNEQTQVLYSFLFGKGHYEKQILSTK